MLTKIFKYIGFKRNNKIQVDFCFKCSYPFIRVFKVLLIKLSAHMLCGGLGIFKST